MTNPITQDLGGVVRPKSYEEAAEVDRWRSDGQSCWMTGDDCSECGHPVATNGRESWCTACPAMQQGGGGGGE